MLLRIVFLLIFGAIFFIGMEPLLESTRPYSHYPEHIPTLIVMGRVSVVLILVWGIWRLLRQIKGVPPKNYHANNENSLKEMR
jgi:ABC-type nickel/cobalt efflux system permease component RcnA